MSNYLNQFGMGDFGGSINGINGNRLGNVDHTGAVLGRTRPPPGEHRVGRIDHQRFRHKNWIY